VNAEYIVDRENMPTIILYIHLPLSAINNPRQVRNGIAEPNSIRAESQNPRGRLMAAALAHQSIT